MISTDLALRLRASGIEWVPTRGDRFVVLDRDLDDTVFAISDMVVEVRHLPTGRILAFNGTTEWALDSIAQRHVVWLPREDQLRSMLGEAFVSLTATRAGFEVVVGQEAREERYVDVDAECAYARAVLSQVSG